MVSTVLSGHETEAEYLTSTGSLYGSWHCFWTNSMCVIRALQTGWVIGGFNGASARILLEPIVRKAIQRNLRIVNSLNRATVQLEARRL